MPLLCSFLLLDLRLLAEALIESNFTVLDIDILLVCLDIGSDHCLLLAVAILCRVGIVCDTLVED